MSPPSEVAPAVAALPADANRELPLALNMEDPVGAAVPGRPGMVPAEALGLGLGVDAEEGPQGALEVQMNQQVPQQLDASMAEEIDPVDLFLNFLEGKMAGTTSNKMICAPECFHGTEVGEGLPSKQVMILSSGSSKIIEADDEELNAQGLKPYPHMYLTTQHILTLTKSLATMHAQILSKGKVSKSVQEVCSNSASRNSMANVSIANENKNTTPEVCQPQLENNQVNVLKDKWTAQVTHLETVDTDMEIVVDVLKNANSSPRTIKKLEALRSDLPTLTQFLQFASSIQTRMVPCIGPIGINDIYLNENEEGEIISMAVRLRTGDEEMKGPVLRDISWLWLTLLEATTLRDRYMELCNEYCSSFNKTFSHLIKSGDCEELSYFDVMRDLGENFLHAFLTIVHKFVSSNTWFFDRRLHTTEGLISLVDIFSFL
ncbi:unnamed protein product, partial [Meganyctiphanes norvegica]